MGKDSAKYWDVSWSPIVGCSHSSPGCHSCWAEKLASSRLAHLPEYAGLTCNGRWTGEVRLLPERLSEPLHWKKPLVVFVDIMSDLFHPAVPFEFINQVFNVMVACPEHTFLVLTKRAERMKECVQWLALHRVGNVLPDNIWCGVTAENQAMADKRIPLLLQTPAAHRWVSLEPCLGSIDLECRLPSTEHEAFNTGPRWLENLDQVIVGGESGPGARTCCDEWIESIVGQCRGAGTPCFVKQCGSNPVHLTRDEHRQPYRDEPVKLKHRSGADPSEWPEELRVRELGWRKEQ